MKIVDPAPGPVIRLDDGRGGWMPAELMVQSLKDWGVWDRYNPLVGGVTRPHSDSATLTTMTADGLLESAQGVGPIGFNRSRGERWFRVGERLRKRFEELLGEGAGDPQLQSAVARLGGLRTP